MKKYNNGGKTPKKVEKKPLPKKQKEIPFDNVNYILSKYIQPQNYEKWLDVELKRQQTNQAIKMANEKIDKAKKSKSKSIPNYNNGGKIYIGGNLPEFTVVSNKDHSNKTLKALYSAQQKEMLPTFNFWEKYGSPDIDIDPNLQGGIFYHDKNKIGVPASRLKGNENKYQELYPHRTGGVKLNNTLMTTIIAELAHAKQLKDKGYKDYNKQIHIDDSKLPHRLQYNMPNTLEHDAHSVKEPNMRKEFKNQSFNNKIDYQYPLGGILPAINMGIDIFKTLSDGFKKPSSPYQANNNIYQMNNGGNIEVANSKQYNAPNHNNGGQLVNANGNTNGNPVAEIQNNENAYKIDDNMFVFSDELDNPMTGRKFNIDFKSLVSKYKNADLDILEKNTLDLEAKNLAKVNEAVKPVNNTPQLNIGGLVRNIAPLINQIYQSRETPMLETLMPTSVESQTAQAPSISNLVPKIDLQQDSDGLGTYDKIALGLKSAGLTQSLLDVIRPKEVETPITPNYQQADSQYYGANADYSQAKQDALAISNQGSNINKNASSTFNTFRAREMSRLNSLSDSLSNITQQEVNADNQIKLNRGRYEALKSQDIANRLYQNRVDNLQNAANNRLAERVFAQDLTRIGTEFNKYQNVTNEIKNNKELANMKIQEGMAILGAKYPNFKPNPQLVEKLKEGNFTMKDLILFSS